MPTASSSLYRPFFTEEEIALLDATQPDDLRSEITLLRIFLARILRACQQQAQMTLAHYTAVLDAFCRAGFSLSALLHAHREPDDERPPQRIPRIFKRLFADPDPAPLTYFVPPRSPAPGALPGFVPPPPPPEPIYRPIEFGDFSHEWPPA